MTSSKQNTTKAAAPRKPRKRAIKSTTQLETAFHILDDDHAVGFRRVLDKGTGTIFAELIHVADFRAEINAAHPPTITPVLHDPAHVIRCDWDVAKNGYRCRKIRSDDPDAKL